MSSSTPIGSSSVKIFPFMFCFMDNIITSPLPRDIIARVCPRQYSYNAYEASTHHLTTYIPLNIDMSFRTSVLLRYFITCIIYPRSYSPGFFTRVVRNVITVCMSLCSWVLMNSSCDTVQWHFWSCSSYIYFTLLLSHTFKSRSTFGVIGVVLSCSRNSLIILCRYFIMGDFTNFSSCIQGTFPGSNVPFLCGP